MVGFAVYLSVPPEKRFLIDNRDYGAMVSNAFGRKAMTRGEVSAVPVKEGETLPMRYVVFVHSVDKQIPTEKLDALFEEFAGR